MKQEVRTILGPITSVLAALPWGAICGAVVNGTSALLGIAGTATATLVAGWIAAVLICASILLIGRTFYVIYVKGVHTRATVIIAWCSLIFMIGFWTTYLLMGGWS